MLTISSARNLRDATKIDLDIFDKLLLFRLRDNQRKSESEVSEDSLGVRSSLRFMVAATRTLTDGDAHDRVTSTRVNNCPHHRSG